MSAILATIIAYLIGSVSSAILLSKLLGYPDPRTTGSGNAGATNILRIAGKKQALWVLLADAFKGILAIWIGRLFGVEGFMLGIVGLAAVLGHIYPVYFKFQGGKGVATAVGAVFAMSFFVGILIIIIWAAVAYFLRY